MNTVDVIGAESVCKWIEQNKLSKFIIFRQGAMKGSTPVFRCDDTKTITQAVDAFKDWASSMSRMNPYNNMPYDMLLMSYKVTEAEIDDDLDETKPKKKDSVHRKVRFSFSLNPFNNMQGQVMGGNVNVKEEIAQALNSYKQEQRIAELERKLKNGDDDEEEDSDEDDTFGKAIKFVQEVNRNKKLNLLEKGVKISGDEDELYDDDDDDEYVEEEEEAGEDNEEEEESPKKKKLTKEGLRLREAILTLKKGNPNYIADLEKIALLKKKQPEMFKSYMATLRKMKF